MIIHISNKSCLPYSPHPARAPPHPARAPLHPARAPPHPARAPLHPARAPPHPARAPPHPARAPPHPAGASPHPARAPLHRAGAPRISVLVRSAGHDVPAAWSSPDWPSPDRIDVHLSRIQPAQMRIDPVARLAPQPESRSERYRWGTSACSVGHEAGRRSLIRCGAARGLMQSRAAHQSRRTRLCGWFRSCACLRGPGVPVNNRRTRIAKFPDRGRRGACHLTGAAGGANGARGTGGP
jgi:hypothetical protein